MTTVCLCARVSGECVRARRAGRGGVCVRVCVCNVLVTSVCVCPGGHGVRERLLAVPVTVLSVTESGHGQSIVCSCHVLFHSVPYLRPFSGQSTGTSVAHT